MKRGRSWYPVRRQYVQRKENACHLRNCPELRTEVGCSTGVHSVKLVTVKCEQRAPARQGITCSLIDARLAAPALRVYAVPDGNELRRCRGSNK